MELFSSKKFDLNKYTSNSSKECVLVGDFEYPKELRESQNDYPSAPDKIEIKFVRLPVKDCWFL